MDGNKKERIGRRMAGALLAMLLPLLFTSSLRAQGTVSLGGTAALGDFINPLKVTVTTGPTDCTYTDLQIDMRNGKVWVRPMYTTTTSACPQFFNTLTDTLLTLADLFPDPAPPGAGGTLPLSFPDGIFEVANFTLRRSNVGPRFDNVILTILANANNTPVWLRSTGNVDIQTSNTLNVDGADGQARVTTFLRGAGGRGGPGGYRGGDGGNGGLSPSSGSTGFGPGGGAGGAVGANPQNQAVFLTTNKTVAGTVIPAGNDLLTIQRGGSGGGGGGGTSGSAAGGGGGGGGAILIAANNTITVNGTLTAAGGTGGAGNGGASGAGGVGGTIRFVAATIAGSGNITTAGGGGGGCWFSPCPVGGQSGTVRLEAFTISYTGSLGGNVAAASAPGQVFMPTSSTVSAFLKISKVTNVANPSEFQDVTNVPNLLINQDIAGRTGVLNPVDVTMPDVDTNPVSLVDVEFTVGPCPGFPATKHITLRVTPLDPAQGSGGTYSTDPAHPGFTAGSTSINCTAAPDAVIKNVALPLGYSSFSAFTVLSIDTGGALARMFPKMYEGEEIESVRIEANARGTEYVLIAKSGKEFPYKPEGGI